MPLLPVNGGFILPQFRRSTIGISAMAVSQSAAISLRIRAGLGGILVTTELEDSIMADPRHAGLYDGVTSEEALQAATVSSAGLLGFEDR